MIESKILNTPVKRIWVLGDMHLGVRSNSMEWLDIQKDFYENVFIPTLKEKVRPGDILIQVGDAFDNRQSINLKVLNYAVDLFERLGEIIPTHIICGNHDIWAKKSNEVTSIDSLKWIPNIQIHKEPKMFKWADKNVLLMPWRRDTEHEVETLAEYPQANMVFCHSEVRGIKLNSKVTNLHGVEANSYDQFDGVWSGHIHYRQKKGKLRMVGVPYQLTRSDANNVKGFDLIDLSDMSETFFENDRSPKFVKAYITSLYNVTLGEFKDEIRNNFVDLFIPSHVAASNSLSKFINQIQNIGRRIEPNIYEQDTFIDKDMYDMEEIEDLYKNYNILHLCNMYIDGMSKDDETKDLIKDRIKRLHDVCAYNYDSEQ